MNLARIVHQNLIALVLIGLLAFTTACGGNPTKSPQAIAPTQLDRTIGYGQISRGNSDVGTDFGNWVVEAVTKVAVVKKSPFRQM
jgi:hypothetical protein